MIVGTIRNVCRSISACSFAISTPPGQAATVGGGCDAAIAVALDPAMRVVVEPVCWSASLRPPAFRTVRHHFPAFLPSLTANEIEIIAHAIDHPSCDHAGASLLVQKMAAQIPK